MVEIDVQIVTCEQMEQLQRQFLKATFNGEVAAVTDKSLESDGRRRGRVLKEAVNTGLLVPSNESSTYGKTYHITAEVIASVIPSTLPLFEIWTALHEKNSHREPYERPWIRVEDLSIEVQCGVLKTDDIDWFVVARTPYEYRANFADAPETILADVSQFHAFNQYWAGPFATLDDAIARRKKISGACIAPSSQVLRRQVAEFFAERKLQWQFANNLLWGLVEVAQVPEDVIFDADGNPAVDKQLEEGYSLRLSSNPNPPANRDAVAWEANLANSIERLKSRITKAEQQLELLRVIQTRVASSGGWGSFMDTLEKKLRTAIAEKHDSPAVGRP